MEPQAPWPNTCLTVTFQFAIFDPLSVCLSIRPFAGKSVSHLRPSSIHICIHLFWVLAWFVCRYVRYALATPCMLKCFSNMQRSLPQTQTLLHSHKYAVHCNKRMYSIKFFQVIKFSTLKHEFDKLKYKNMYQYGSLAHNFLKTVMPVFSFIFLHN